MEVQANVVVLTMAWQTHQHPSQFSLQAKEPDVETLVYWVQRLEPLVTSGREDEVIVVFCNRTGAEDEVTYTGTSAVLGVKAGNVFIYGILGRGESGLLVVDTSQPPISKLTEQPNVETEKQNVVEDKATDLKDTVADNKPQPPEPLPAKPARETLTLELPNPQIKVTHPTPLSPKLPWLASDTAARSPTNPRSPTKLQIPVIKSRTVIGEFTLIDSALADNVVIESPSSSRSPSPVDSGRRTKPPIPTTPAWRFRNKQSPSPWHFNSGPHSAVFSGGACMTPITPFEVEDLWNSTPIDPKPPNWYWKHEQTLTAVNESIQEDEEPEESPKNSAPPAAHKGSAPEPRPILHAQPLDLRQPQIPLPPYHSTDLDNATPIDEEPPDWYWKHEPTLAAVNESLEDEPEYPIAEDSEYISTPINQEPPEWYWKHEPSLSALQEDEEDEEEPEPSYTTSSTSQPHTESHATNSQTQSQSQSQQTSPEWQPRPEQEWQSLSSVLSNLKIHPNSSFNARSRSPATSDNRPSSPKSRNASRHGIGQRSQSPVLQLGRTQHCRPPSRLRHAISAAENFDDDVEIDDEAEPEPEPEPQHEIQFEPEHRGRTGRLGTERSRSRVYELSRGRQTAREGSVERSRSVGRSRLRYQPIAREEENADYEQDATAAASKSYQRQFDSGAGGPRESVTSFGQDDDERWGGMIDHWEGGHGEEEEKEEEEEEEEEEEDEEEDEEEEEAHPALVSKVGVASSSVSDSTLGDSIPSPDTPEYVGSTVSFSSLGGENLGRRQLLVEEKPRVVVEDVQVIGIGAGSGELNSAASLLNEEWARRREEAVRRGTGA